MYKRNKTVADIFFDAESDTLRPTTQHGMSGL